MPASLLQRAVNRARLATVPRLFSTELAPLDVRLHRVERPFADADVSLSSAPIAASFRRDSRAVDHLEQVGVLHGDFTIDPTSGFVLHGRSLRAVRQSIIYDHPSVYPSLARRWRGRAARLPEVVQFDHHWGTMYFHFYSDMLHKLWLLDAHPHLVPDVPLVISRKSFESKFFRFFRTFPAVAGRRWRVQEVDEIIEAERVWLVQCMPFEATYWRRTRELVEPHRKPVRAGRRVFVNRPASIGRSVDNVSELQPVLDRFGFQTVELERASMEEQIALFSEAEMVVTMHGAALSNLIYSAAPTRVLELMPDEAISCHYFWVAAIMGLSYDAVLGSPLRIDRVHSPRGTFSVAPATLEAALHRALAAA